jgi:hypothetical protein
MLCSKPTMIKLLHKDDIPAETNGKVIPATGMTPRFIPILRND